MPDRNNSLSNRLQYFSIAKPILTALVLMAIALFLKWIDTFVLRLDERLGEIILSKSLGFILVIVFIWLTRHKLKDIGLHSKRIGQSLLIGASVTLLAYVLAYGVEYLLAAGQNAEPEFLVSALDNKMGVTGGYLFALLLVFGNFINAFMEEGLFRGLMIPLFLTKLSFVRTNWLQAFLFGSWHLMWVFKYYQMGTIQTSNEILMSTFLNFMPQLLIGLVWGYMYFKTNSLWAPWISHVLNNSILNLLHVDTLQGMDSLMMVRMPIFTILALLSMLLVKYMAEKFQMAEVQPWQAIYEGDE
jgi:membrane protease YdiL (CAAX protease family)